MLLDTLYLSLFCILMLPDSKKMLKPYRMHSINYTLVLATPISGPALTWTPQSVSLQMELPTVLVMPTVRALWFLQ